MKVRKKLVVEKVVGNKINLEKAVLFLHPLAIQMVCCSQLSGFLVKIFVVKIKSTPFTRNSFCRADLVEFGSNGQRQIRRRKVGW
jgi:hypothetical protein